MKTEEVALKLVQLCREGNNLNAINELYDDGIVSKEPGMELKEGKEAIIEKNIQWFESVAEIHSLKISDPLVADDHFTCVMDFDITFKQHGRMPMSEICVYKVKDGKIVTEEFFYSMPG